jgi:ABC-type ATPase involved in cell division
MNDDDLILIGEHYGLGRMASRPFGIQRADRRQGLHLIGQSGAGKSSLMLDMIRQDIERGEGVTFIDPHGLNAEKLLDHIPPERLERFARRSADPPLR